MAGISAHILGCKVNFADAQKIYHRLSGGEETQPAALVGTCCVTAEGEKQSRKEVRRAARRVGPSGKVYVTGCAARRAPEMFRDLARNVVIVDDEPVGGEREAAVKTGRTPEKAGEAGIARSRYFLKVQDGCANRCSYCVIPQVRGEPRSLSLAEILANAREAVALGYPELVVAGIDTGAWQSGAARLPRLLESLAGIEGLKRLRLSSIAINHLTDDLIAVIKETPLIGRHLHLPLQSGDDGVLRSMNRQYRRRDFSARLQEARRQIPEINVTTDLIVGFPTEDDAAFANTLAFVEECGFTGIHVFTYSPRPGTRSLSYGDPVPPDDKKRRSQAARRLSRRLQHRHRERKVGGLSEILLESRKTEGMCMGYSSDYTRFLVEGGRPGAMVRVQACGVREEGVAARIID